ncbi:unknown protein [Seminavis robusta]|uniref:Uncharacterized protein n=1 Tax=Seminavis robusta TaxID=568900 RepID=A0A9N8D7X2_9STRA|nr:unknown protein [Seminavis robusta]|eukprot:Sro10_g008121.1  (213) ;mRNA; f:127168-127806
MKRSPSEVEGKGIPSCIFVPACEFPDLSHRRNSEPVLGSKSSEHSHKSCSRTNATVPGTTEIPDESFSSYTSSSNCNLHESGLMVQRVPRKTRRFSQPVPPTPVPACLDRAEARFRRWATTGTGTGSNCRSVSVCTAPPSLPQRSPEVLRKQRDPRRGLPALSADLASMAQSIQQQRRRSNSMSGPPKCPLRDSQTTQGTAATANSTRCSSV